MTIDIRKEKEATTDSSSLAMCCVYWMKFKSISLYWTELQRSQWSKTDAMASFFYLSFHKSLFGLTMWSKMRGQSKIQSNNQFGAHVLQLLVLLYRPIVCMSIMMRCMSSNKIVVSLLGFFIFTFRHIKSELFLPFFIRYTPCSHWRIYA